jgi:hypothetical protein
MPLTFTFDIRLDEMQRASTMVQNRQPVFSWMRRLAIASPLILVALNWLSTGNLRQALWDNVWFAGFIVVMMFGLVPWLQRWTVRKAYDANPAMRGHQTCEFSSDGLKLAGPLSSVSLAWPAILEAVETEEFFLFFVQKAFAYYLPKRAVADGGDITELRSLIRNELGSRAEGVQAAMKTSPSAA